MSRFIWVNPSRLEKGRRTEQGPEGVSFEVEVSPFSMPQTVFGTYEQATGRFVIEFRYIDQEASPSPRKLGNEGIVIREGQYSGKILSIEIPVSDQKSKDIGHIELKLIKMFNDREQAAKSHKSRKGRPDLLNQKVAQEILQKKP